MNRIEDDSSSSGSMRSNKSTDCEASSRVGSPKRPKYGRLSRQNSIVLERAMVSRSLLFPRKRKKYLPFRSSPLQSRGKSSRVYFDSTEEVLHRSGNEDLLSQALTGRVGGKDQETQEVAKKSMLPRSSTLWIQQASLPFFCFRSQKFFVCFSVCL